MTLTIIYGKGSTHDRRAALNKFLAEDFDGVVAGTLTGAESDPALIASVWEMLASGSSALVQVSSSTEDQAAEMIGQLVQCAPVYIQAPARNQPYPHVA